MEREVVMTLNWNLSVVCPHDFLEIFIRNLPFPLSEGTRLQLREHGSVFVDMCYTEYKFSLYGPGLIAAASLYLAVIGLATGKQAVPEVPAAAKANMLSLGAYFPPLRASLLPACIRDAEELFHSYSVVPADQAPASDDSGSPLRPPDASFSTIADEALGL